MNEQGALVFDFGENGRRSIQERFMAFHRAHPEVYARLVKLARDVTAAGRARIGISMLWETLRYFSVIEGLPDPDEDFKLSNDYRSRYARLIMEQEPDLAGLFELRPLRAE